MRNFSVVTKRTRSTLVVSSLDGFFRRRLTVDGPTFEAPSDILTESLELCYATEANEGHWRKEFIDVHRVLVNHQSTSELFSKHLTPGDFRVLVDFVRYALRVKSALRDARSSHDGQASCEIVDYDAFTHFYSNLNTGKVFSYQYCALSIG